MTVHLLFQFAWLRQGSRKCIALAGLLMLLVGVGHGQEALRLSLAGDVAAASRQQAGASLGYYNLLLGPAALRFSTGLGVQFTDNVHLTPVGESDMIFQPSVNLQMHWPVTLENSLDISMGVGYSAYLKNPDMDQIFVNQGSGLSFDVYVGDIKINLHDRVSITEDPYQNVGSGGANQVTVSLQNTAGVSAQWDMDKVVSNIGFDHANYVDLSQNAQSQPNGVSENLYVNSGVRVRPELLLGLEAGGSVITYNQSSGNTASSYPNAVQWSVGGFGSTKISEHLDARLDVGYTVYTPQSSFPGQLQRNASGVYFSFSISHRVNEILSYSLSAGRNADLASFGQPQAYYFVRFSPSWNLIRNYPIGTQFWWQQGKQINSWQAGGIGNYAQYGVGVSVGRSLTKKLSATISYQFVDETSSQANANYTVNTLNLMLTYQF